MSTTPTTGHHATQLGQLENQKEKTADVGKDVENWTIKWWCCFGHGPAAPQTLVRATTGVLSDTSDTKRLLAPIPNTRSSAFQTPTECTMIQFTKPSIQRLLQSPVTSPMLPPDQLAINPGSQNSQLGRGLTKGFFWGLM